MSSIGTPSNSVNGHDNSIRDPKAAAIALAQADVLAERIRRQQSRLPPSPETEGQRDRETEWTDSSRDSVSLSTQSHEQKPVPEYLRLLWEQSKHNRPQEAQHYVLPGMRDLVALCAQLGAQGDVWFLSCRDAGALLGVTFQQAARWLNRLRHDGLLEIVEAETKVRARRYRYVTQPPKQPTKPAPLIEGEQAGPYSHGF